MSSALFMFMCYDSQPIIAKTRKKMFYKKKRHISLKYNIVQQLFEIRLYLGFCEVGYEID